MPGSYLNLIQDSEGCNRLCSVQIAVFAAVSPLPLISGNTNWVFGVVIVARGPTPTIVRPLWVDFFKTIRCLPVLMDDHDLVLIIRNC